MKYVHKVEPGSVVDLNEIDAKRDGGMSKEEGEARVDELGTELDRLQELLFAARTHSVLVVLQGMDTSGKDGVIRKVFRYVDPLGCRVWPFGVPSEEEMGHDFLWRIHKKTPEQGYIGVFNRSHYEDVVVVRVDELIPESIWSKRYEHINAFERDLADANTIVVKFFLHISKEEQKERLQAREQLVEKAYKLSSDDWRKRTQWADYMAAWNDALSKCSTEVGPWYVVPSDRKWFRDLGVMETMVSTLDPYQKGWIEHLGKQGEDERQAIRELQAES